MSTCRDCHGLGQCLARDDNQKKKHYFINTYCNSGGKRGLRRGGEREGQRRWMGAGFFQDACLRTPPTRGLFQSRPLNLSLCFPTRRATLRQIDREVASHNSSSSGAVPHELWRTDMHPIKERISLCWQTVGWTSKCCDTGADVQRGTFRPLYVHP